MINDYYNTITPPATYPVTLAEAKEWIRVNGTIEDVLITALISAATTIGEAHTNRQFVTRTMEGFFAGADASRFELHPFVQIRRAPASNVTVDMLINGEFTAVTDYAIWRAGGFDRIIFNDGVPSHDMGQYPIKVTFDAGYDIVPDGIRTAIKQHILFMYENRGDVVPDGVVSMPIESKFLYSSYRIQNTFG